MVLVFEGAVDYIPDLEDKFSGGPAGRGLRYNGPGTSVSGNPELASRHFGEVEPADRFPDSTSWGYRLAGRLEYPNLDRSLEPRAAFLLDARREGHLARPRRQLRRGPLRPDARRRREPAGERGSWTRRGRKFGGAGRCNDLNDRDFATASVKVSF